MTWAEMALRISFAKVEAQRNEVVRIRSQAMFFVTFLGTAIAFLVGAVMTPDVQRTPLFYSLATTGTALLGLLAVFLLAILIPWVKFHFSQNAEKLLGWTGGPQPTEDYLDAINALVTKALPRDLQRNRKGLIKLRWFFGGLIVSGVFSLTTWIWILWACA